MKKIFVFILLLCVTLSFMVTSFASDMEDVDTPPPTLEVSTLDPDTVNARSAILIDTKTGTVLFEKNADEMLPPASVTKVMTLLIVCEALERGAFSLVDKVKVSGNSSSMGGSQVFLEEGEEFTVEELIKCTVIASANDAAVALAELTAGSEEAFVEKMNDRAFELGLNNTHFENVTGLDDDTHNHLTSAKDIATMSRELLKYDIILKYSGLWQDSIRDGSFILTNTNRLVRYYDGCTGLKTGYTDKAGYCISASAERGGMHLVAVIMGAPTRDERNNSARMLFDWGFANYSLFSDKEEFLEDIDVLRSDIQITSIYTRGFDYLSDKLKIGKIEKIYEIPDYLVAPIKKGDVIGKVKYYIDEEEIGEADIYVNEDIEEISTFKLFLEILLSALIGK